MVTLRVVLIGAGCSVLLGCGVPPPAPTPPPPPRPIAASSPAESPAGLPAEAAPSPPIDLVAQERQAILAELPAEDSPPLPESPSPAPAPPPPPPEIPADVRTRLEVVGAKIYDKPSGYAIDVRNKPRFTDAEIDLVVECPQVVDLTLEHVAITNEGLKKLEALPDVARLILNGCPISSDGIATLAELPVRKKLFSIGLRGTKVTDDDIQQFSKFPRLQRIDVSQTAVTDACLPALERLPLRYLNVAETQITEAGLNALKQKKPNLEIKGQ